MLENFFWYHHVSLVKTNRNIYMATLKGHFQNLIKGQGHRGQGVDRKGHVAYQSMRLDETNTLEAFSRLYLTPIKSY